MPPAPNGTTSRTGRSGNPACAPAPSPAASASAAKRGASAVRQAMATTPSPSCQCPLRVCAGISRPATARLAKKGRTRRAISSVSTAMHSSPALK
ncbi:hypothetical protein G6F32_017411 [Rhizopus arrhizus]|nr:hypothetical protein G6F32_017411 [Rhizopus arrhizus]